MTEALQSPDNNLMGLKRRKADFCDSDDAENFNTARFGTINKRSRQSSSRHEESENMRPFLGSCSINSSSSGGNQNSFFQESDRGKVRKMGEADPFESSSYNRSAQFFQDQVQQMQKYHESQTLSIKTEYQMNLDKAQREMECLRTQNKSLLESNQSMSGGYKNILDENKVLKRAVGIQDSRLNDQHQQNQQYQRIISQATEYVQKLQEDHKQLETQLRLTQQQLSQALSSNRGGNHYDPELPPPDVF